MKANQKAEIKEVFGERMSTSLFIKLIAYFPEILKTLLELIAVWKEHKAKKEANKLMDDGGEPDPGTTPDPPKIV